MTNLIALPANFPYCERLLLDAEPWNVASNLAFALLGGYALHRRSAHRAAFHRIARDQPTTLADAGPRQTPGTHASLWLVWLPFAIAAGSAAYHAMPNPLTLFLDLAPIGAFVALALWLILDTSLGLPRATTITAWLIWAVATAIMATRADQLYGSLVYLPSLVALVLLSAFATHQANGIAQGVAEARSIDTRNALAVITVAFAAALVARTLDYPLCKLPANAERSAAFTAEWSVGTHVLWHVLAAAAGAFAIRLLLPVRGLSQQA